MFEVANDDGMFSALSGGIMRRDSRDKSLRPVARHLATVAGNITPPHHSCLKTPNILGIYARPLVNLIPKGNLIRFKKTLVACKFIL